MANYPPQNPLFLLLTVPLMCQSLVSIPYRSAFYGHYYLHQKNPRIITQVCFCVLMNIRLILMFNVNSAEKNAELC